MSVEWFHLSPVILSDTVYFPYISPPAYSGTQAQRNAAYLAAEQLMIEEIGTPLLPTTMTGTWMWPNFYSNPTLLLPFSHLQSVDDVTVLYGGGTGICGLQTTPGCYRIVDGGYGYINAYCIGQMALAGCGCRLSDLWQVRIAFTAGLPTGVAANDTSLHAALAMVAEEALNEFVDPASNPGGPGAPGVTSWGSLGYNEKPNEKSLRMTALGASARMNRAAKLVRHLKRYRALRF